MNDQLKVRAAIQGIDPERFEILQELGISLENASVFKEMKLDELRWFAQFDFDGDELARFYKRGDTQFEQYASVRKAYSEEVVTTCGIPVPTLKSGLDAGLTLDDTRWAYDHEMRPVEYGDAKKYGVTREELLAAKEAIPWVYTYFEARKQGIAHTEIVEIAPLLPPHRFGVQEYLELRQGGVSADDAKAAISTLDVNQLENYAKYRTGYRGQSHELTMQLLGLGVSSNDYMATIRSATFDEIVELITLGFDLSEYRKIRDVQIRVKHHEIIEYGRLRGKLEVYGIKGYIKLLDAGLSYEELTQIFGESLSFHDISELISPLYGLGFAEVLELKNTPSLNYKGYTKLRQDGMDHDTIIRLANAIEDDDVAWGRD